MKLSVVYFKVVKVLCTFVNKVRKITVFEFFMSDRSFLFLVEVDPSTRREKSRVDKEKGVGNMEKGAF